MYQMFLGEKQTISVRILHFVPLSRILETKNDTISKLDIDI